MIKPHIQTLHHQALDCAKRFKRAEADLVDVLQKLDTHKVYLRLKYTSLFVYAVQALGLSEANASNFITVARKAKEVPQLSGIRHQGSRSNLVRVSV